MITHEKLKKSYKPYPTRHQKLSEPVFIVRFVGLNALAKRTRILMRSLFFYGSLLTPLTLVYLVRRIQSVKIRERFFKFFLRMIPRIYFMISSIRSFQVRSAISSTASTSLSLSGRHCAITTAAIAGKSRLSRAQDSL
jgi:hypothetical protein